MVFERLKFYLAFFEEPETLPDNLTSVAVSPLSDLSADKFIKVFAYVLTHNGFSFLSVITN